jgi:hypothetical protein
MPGVHDREGFYPENDIKAFAIMETPSTSG